MSEDNKPGPGDRVRVTFEGTIETLDDHGRVGRVMGDSPQGAWLSYIPEFASVEVVERADDPSLGEIRRVAPSLDGEPKTAVKVGGSLSLMPSERFLWVVVETGEMLADGNIDVQEVVGAVPGTPAWERQQVELEHTDLFEPEVADAPPLPVADPDAYPHYYQSEDIPDELWRVDGLDGPVMWRQHGRDAWEVSSCRNEEALVAMQGGHIHRYFDEVPS